MAGLKEFTAPKGTKTEAKALLGIDKRQALRLGTDEVVEEREEEPLGSERLRQFQGITIPTRGTEAYDAQLLGLKLGESPETQITTFPGAPTRAIGTYGTRSTMQVPTVPTGVVYPTEPVIRTVSVDTLKTEFQSLIDSLDDLQIPFDAFSEGVIAAMEPLFPGAGSERAAQSRQILWRMLRGDVNAIEELSDQFKTRPDYQQFLGALIDVGIFTSLAKTPIRAVIQILGRTSKESFTNLPNAVRATITKVKGTGLDKKAYASYDPGDVPITPTTPTRAAEMAEEAAPAARAAYDPGDVPITPTTTARAAEVAEEAAPAARAAYDPGDVPITPTTPARADIPVPTGFVDPNSSLGKIEAMWQRGGKHVPVEEPVKFLKFQENWNDAFFGLRKMQGRVDPGGYKILPGSDKDLITLLTRGPGSAGAGATRFVLAIQEMRKLAPNTIADDIGSYVFAQHGKEVFTAKGRKRVLGEFTNIRQMDDTLEQLAAKVGPEGFEEIEKAAGVLKSIYREERERFVKAGIFTQEFADDMAVKYPWYNPIHYVEYVEKEAAKTGRQPGFNVLNNGVIALSEVGSKGDVVRPLEVFAETLIRNEVRLQQNATGKAIVSLALEDKLTGVNKISGVRPVATVTGETAEETIKIFRPTGQDIPGTISFMENGTRKIYEVPDWLYRETNLMNQTLKHPVVSFVSALNGISRAAFTTYNPTFVAANVLNDTLTAFITRGIMPHETAMTLMRTLRGLHNDKIMQAFRLSGGYQGKFFGRDAAQMAAEVGATGGQLIGSTNSLKAWMRKTRDIIPTVGEAGEQAPRMALFRRELNKNLPGWKNMTAEEIARTPQARKAAADAVELTINFARGAYYIKSANTFMLFLNAAMEGTKLPFRALASNPKARWRLAGVGAGYTSIMAYNMSYPEYFDIPNGIRWGSAVIMLPSKEKNLDGSPKPRYITIVPRTREWGAFLGPIAYSMEQIFSDNPTEFITFARTLMPELLPVGEIPSPQIISTLFEQGTNFDFYRQRPIVPREMEGLEKDQQITPWVSRTIAEVANTTGLVSPLELQHAVQGVLGGAGSTATSVSDYILNYLMPPEKNPRIQKIVDAMEAAETRVERDKIWARLSSEDRAAVKEVQQQPREQLPVVGPIIRRVMPGRGGQLWQTGQEVAEVDTGVSTRQTREVSRRLRNKADLQLTEQQKDDKKLDLEGKPGGISHGTWRERRSNRAIEYRGLLKDLGIEFPKAAQVIVDPKAGDRYFELVATVAGTQPDRRTKGEILAAGWYAIVLEERGDGEKDFAKFFAMRDEYEVSLSAEDAKLMHDTLNAKQTPTEVEFLEDSRAMRGYFDLTVNEMRRVGQLELYAMYLSKSPKQQGAFKEANPDLARTLRLLVIIRKDWRDRNPDIAALLLKWDHISRPVDRQARFDLLIENERARDRGEFALPATTTVPVGGVR